MAKSCFSQVMTRRESLTYLTMSSLDLASLLLLTVYNMAGLSPNPPKTRHISTEAQKERCILNAYLGSKEYSLN